MSVEGSSRGELLVSVITPTLNRRHSLRRTLDSVAEQDYEPIEHVIVDGGSTDGTIELLRDYESRSGIRWISEPDAGVYSAVNKGLRMASGDILSYINSDDAYFPYTVYAAVERLRSSRAGFVFGDLLRFDESKGSGMLLFYPPYRHQYLARGNVIAQPTVFWRREAFIQCGLLDEDLRLAADMDYWLRIGQRFGGEHLDEVLAYEGHHESRLTSGAAAVERGKAELRRIEAQHPSIDARPKIDRWLDRSRAAYWYRRQVLRFLWHCRRNASSPAPWRGFRHDPTFRIDTKMMMLALLPYIGRRFKWNVYQEPRAALAAND